MNNCMGLEIVWLMYEYWLREGLDANSWESTYVWIMRPMNDSRLRTFTES